MWTKEDISFKKLINRRTTDSIKEFYEEFGDSTLTISTNDIFAEEIPFDDPTQGITNNVVAEYNLFLLKENITVPNNQAYFTCTNPNDPYDFSKPDDITNPRLKNWISDKFGESYKIKLFDNNDNQIFPTDESDWIFDYKTGILLFNGNVNTISYPKPFKISGYRYVGQKLSDFVGGNNNGEFTIEEFTPNNTTGNTQDTGAISNKSYVGQVLLFINHAHYVISKTDITSLAFFSNDGGISATPDTNGATIYWNGLDAGFDLNASTDKMVLVGFDDSATSNPQSLDQLVRSGMLAPTNKLFWTGSEYRRVKRYEFPPTNINGATPTDFSILPFTPQYFDEFTGYVLNGNLIYKLPYNDGTNILYGEYNSTTDMLRVFANNSFFDGWILRIIIDFTN